VIRSQIGQNILFELLLKVSTRTRDTIIFADTENICGHGETCLKGRCLLKERRCLLCAADHCQAMLFATERYTLLLLNVLYNDPLYVFIKLFFFYSLDPSKPSV
jgi:hypothetical protein